MSERNREARAWNRVGWGRHPAARSWYSVKRHRRRLDSCPAFKLLFAARRRVKNAIGKGGLRPVKSISSVIGCTGEFLLQHLASQFQTGLLSEADLTMFRNHLSARASEIVWPVAVPGTAGVSPAPEASATEETEHVDFEPVHASTDPDWNV